jgi:hypothetical protein
MRGLAAGTWWTRRPAHWSFFCLFLAGFSSSEDEEAEEEDDEEVTPAAEFECQRRVLVHVQAEITRQVRAVDEAMRQAEREFDTDAEWREKQAQRDAELESLDQGLVAWQETGGQSADSESIGKAMDALTRLATLHHEMQEIEARMVPQGSEQHARNEAKQRLQRLREQRVRRPRILFGYGVSSHVIPDRLHRPKQLPRLR